MVEYYATQGISLRTKPHELSFASEQIKFEYNEYKKAKSTKNWASKAVLGERVYLNRDKVDIPSIHKTPLLKMLNIVSSIGMGLTIWAMIYYSVWGAVFGTALAYLGKSWYLDRMVWLYEDMKDENQEYSKWEY